jgi:hypothetical protein
VTQLDALYAQTLQVGFMVLRQAVESGNREWIDAELELLHNVPSLLREDNKARHRYFWHKERTCYIDWVSAPGRDKAKSRMLTYYEPIWNEMEPFMKQFLQEN